MSVDKRGHLVYSHQKDALWDVNDFLLELKGELKNWRDVYWRLWGHVNYLTCSRCADIFPCAELGQSDYWSKLKSALHLQGPPLPPFAISVTL